MKQVYNCLAFKIVISNLNYGTSLKKTQESSTDKQSFLLPVKSFNQIHDIKSISVAAPDFMNTRLSFCC